MKENSRIGSIFRPWLAQRVVLGEKKTTSRIQNFHGSEQVFSWPAWVMTSMVKGCRGAGYFECRAAHVPTISKWKNRRDQNFISSGPFRISSHDSCKWLLFGRLKQLFTNIHDTSRSDLRSLHSFCDLSPCPWPHICSCGMSEKWERQ